MGDRPRFPLGHRPHLELPHATHHGGTAPPHARRRAGAVSGRYRQDAERSVVVEPAHRQAPLFRISEVYRRPGPIPPRKCTGHGRRCPIPLRLIQTGRIPLHLSGRAVILFRSILFNILFYLNLFVYFIAAIPSLFLPYRVVVAFAKAWGRTDLWLLRAVCGIDVEWIGLEKIPKGPLIVASKHQSLWETFGLLTRSA